MQDTAELGQRSFQPGILLFRGQFRLLWREEDGVGVGVYGMRHPMLHERTLQDPEVSIQPLRFLKPQSHNGAGGVVDGAMEAEEAAG